MPLIYDFANVPEPSPEYHHQSNTMALVRYRAAEGQRLSAGAPIVLLENWWAVFEVSITVPAVLAKNFFDGVPGIELPVGTPVALLFFEPDDLTSERPVFDTRVVSQKRERPGRR
jgi:hypothetical protein